MPVIAVIGGQWGDEAKGKVIDVLAEDAGAVVRFSGGSNAGHTVVNQFGEFRLHLVPAGIFYPKTLCIIGNGVVVDPAALLEEIEALESKGIDTSRLFISDRAHLIMPYHLLQDELEEKARGGGALGTTRKGIGPCFADKVARIGLRVGDLLDKEAFKEQLHFVLGLKNRLLTRVYEIPPLSFEEIYTQYLAYAKLLKPHIGETSQLLNELVAKGELVLLEGAQGTMLDPDFGSYPYVTSSAPTAAGACLGTGLPPSQLTVVLGIFKAYTTRVGSGPFPTELVDALGARIRERAQEYGATTGRPRRCGWFDAVVARFSVQLNGCTAAAITRLDIFDELPTIKICTAYRVKEQVYHQVPAAGGLFQECQPVYEKVGGWQSSLAGVRRYEELPPQAQAYIRRLEELMGCPVSIISVGPSREQTIKVRPLL